MAASEGKTTGKKTGRKTSSANQKNKRSAAKSKTARADQDRALFHEIGLIALFAAMVFLFCCNFGLAGPVGNAVSGAFFGLFGLSAYVLPVLLLLAVAFWFANEGNPTAVRKLAAGTVLFFMAGIVCDLIGRDAAQWEGYDAVKLYETCRENGTGGGLLSGSLSFFLQGYLGILGTALVVLLCSVVSLILLTEKSLLGSVRRGGRRIRERSREDLARRRERMEERRLELEGEAQNRRKLQEEQRARREQERRLRAEEKENEKILRMDQRTSAVSLDVPLFRPEDRVRRRDDMHEIVWAEEALDAAPSPEGMGAEVEAPHPAGKPGGEGQDSRPDPQPLIRIHRAEPARMEEAVPWPESAGMEEAVPGPEPAEMEEAVPGPEALPEEREEDVAPAAVLPAEEELPAASAAPAQPEKAVPKKYRFPSISLLQKGTTPQGDSERELRETAMHLQQTLATFGVKVTVTDISQGPSVTRYELQPEQGVKVSRIVSLADDIKLNLAAMDIRIEAPIPGKAAIGIEVPNQETMPVGLRELLETKEFRDFQSNLAFAVGKDIAGRVVVSDIAKMPHMLIAGATGSGKSVCINTLIISILYKAHPDDVKLIMVDPKVVELSIYNGIPHLLIPVVTDPKKASAALHWGVSEMDDRYRKFAEYGARNLKEYNKKVEALQKKGAADAPPKLPQIVIIVDELADLMMVCPGEVEASICRLAQLARACGIHLVIATQRPSVDVITGLIKANMPSRVAFAVSSGVDSRTILDMVGAERLLGRGDMLFYPQGLPKPARVQGAFVSDQEVADIVDFLKNQALGNGYAEEIEEKIASLGSGGAEGEKISGGSDVDELFGKAGRLIIDKDRASIGMLQRVLQIGFNRAARIMDQLCQYGVVSQEEGTKPRKILMSPEQFEQLLDEVA